MRPFALALLLAVPLTARAQYPAPGRYDGMALVAGSESGPGAITLVVTAEGDSTLLSLHAGGNAEQTVPISAQGILDQGFTMVLEVIPGGLHCRFVTLSTKWEAYCEDQAHEPQYVVWFDRTPTPPKETPDP
jgi:hypothetical protein